MLTLTLPRIHLPSAQFTQLSSVQLQPQPRLSLASRPLHRHIGHGPCEIPSDGFRASLNEQVSGGDQNLRCVSGLEESLSILLIHRRTPKPTLVACSNFNGHRHTTHSREKMHFIGENHRHVIVIHHKSFEYLDLP